MKPYYQDDAVTIYHGDCREIMGELDFDAIVSDPPYGINVVNGGTVGGNNAGQARQYLAVAGDDEPFDPSFLLTGVPTILWGANHYGDHMPSASKWLVWDKRVGGTSDNFADCELAWTNLGGPARLHRQLWRGMIAKRSSQDGDRAHPTQKPVALMHWCLGFIPEATAILDPFMGSGTTLRAAKDIGVHSIGIDTEELYCEIAAQRCAQDVLDLGMAQETRRETPLTEEAA